MDETGGHYIHGTDPEEQERLSLLNDLLNDTSLRAMNIVGGEKILDVGSGLGQLACDMAGAAAPEGQVVGIERDPKQLAEAKGRAAHPDTRGRIDFREGDAVDFPLEKDEWGDFDIAHARFLLEHVPDPQAVVRAMVRAVKPGGRIILEDDDHDVLRFWPEPPGAYRLWRAYIRAYDHLGNDPYVGRRLVALLHEGGADPVRNNWMFFGSCSGDPSFRAFVDNFVGVLQGAREMILSAPLLESGVFDEGIDSLKAWGQRSDAALWYGTYWAEGRRPDAA